MNSLQDHKVISEIFGFNLPDHLEKKRNTDKETKIEILGMVMRLLLRSQALLSVSLQLYVIKKKNQCTKLI